MSQRHLLHKEIHLLEDKIQRIMGDLERLTKQKADLQVKLLKLNLEEAFSEIEEDERDEERRLS